MTRYKVMYHSLVPLQHVHPHQRSARTHFDALHQPVDARRSRPQNHAAVRRLVKRAPAAPASEAPRVPPRPAAQSEQQAVAPDLEYAPVPVCSPARHGGPAAPGPPERVHVERGGRGRPHDAEHAEGRGHRDLPAPPPLLGVPGPGVGPPPPLAPPPIVPRALGAADAERHHLCRGHRPLEPDFVPEQEGSEQPRAAATPAPRQRACPQRNDLVPSPPNLVPSLTQLPSPTWHRSRSAGGTGSAALRRCRPRTEAAASPRNIYGTAAIIGAE
ncbi:hypothetical protein Pelo_6271 [Pelomyxa schiedti]|nr:hypothetical protein Pelo_6271 [Pelomyxa schiedti]